MLAQLYHLCLGIIKPKNQLISLDMEEFIIESTLKFLVVTIIGLGTDEKYYKHINQTIIDDPRR